MAYEGGHFDGACGGSDGHPNELMEVVSDPHGRSARAFVGVLAGLATGLLMAGSLSAGARLAVDSHGEAWGYYWWGEHWAIRTAASWLASYSSGIILGLVARSRGAILGLLSAVLPSAAWGQVALSSLGVVAIPWLHLQDLSIGNKVAAVVLAVTTVPITIVGGADGATLGSELGPHFDSRRRSLLGIKWFHYLWLPIVVHAAIFQFWGVGLYGFDFLRSFFRSGLWQGLSLASIVPMAMYAGLVGTLSLSGKGLSRAYLLLAGFESPTYGRSTAREVIQNAFGLPLLAALAQAGILFAYAAFLTWARNH